MGEGDGRHRGGAGGEDSRTAGRGGEWSCGSERRQTYAQHAAVERPLCTEHCRVMGTARTVHRHGRCTILSLN